MRRAMVRRGGSAWLGLAAVLVCGVAAAEPTGLLDRWGQKDVEVHGFVDVHAGRRTGLDPNEGPDTLAELRVQLDLTWFAPWMTLQVKPDLLYDFLADEPGDLELETGLGFLDLRVAAVQFSPLDVMDVKLGRQIITWGTGDLVFINDLFPKDWQAFFLGRDDEYLKAPSDAFLVSLFPAWLSCDLVYVPRFDADRYMTGERLSYWNGQAVVGDDAVLRVDRPDAWLADDEVAVRLYRGVGGYEVAVYGYDGYWKSPAGFDEDTGRWTFPRLRVYGASARGPLARGIAHVEAGYYDSLDDRDGDDAMVANSEFRCLAGYSRELAKDLTIGLQYYLERMLDYDEDRRARVTAGLDTETMREEDRHTVTLRLTQLLMSQNLILSLFVRYSPSDQDAYIKPSVLYKVDDRWRASVGANVFVGDDRHTFLAQFEDNNNVHGAVRYSF